MANVLFFDPAVDTLCLDGRVSFWSRIIRGSLQTLEYHKESILEAQHLIFARLIWFESSAKYLELESGQTFVNGCYIEPLTVHYFTKLKKLDLMVDSYYWNLPPFSSNHERYGVKKLILGYFERRSAANPDFPIPEITIQKGSPYQ
jgi:hypothetical protein